MWRSREGHQSRYIRREWGSRKLEAVPYGGMAATKAAISGGGDMEGENGGEDQRSI